VLTLNVIASSLEFPGSLVNFGKRENVERETSAPIYMSRAVVSAGLSLALEVVQNNVCQVFPAEIDVRQDDCCWDVPQCIAARMGMHGQL
jgi:hypothetical protein